MIHSYLHILKNILVVCITKNIGDELVEIRSGYVNEGATMQWKVEHWNGGRLLMGYFLTHHSRRLEGKKILFKIVFIHNPNSCSVVLNTRHFAVYFRTRFMIMERSGQSRGINVRQFSLRKKALHYLSFFCTRNLLHVFIIINITITFIIIIFFYY